MNDRPTPPSPGASADENLTLDAYLDGELDREARAAFEAALSRDPDLAATLERHAALDARLHASLAPLSDADDALVRGALEESLLTTQSGAAADRAAPRLPPRTPWLAAVALAASLILVIRLDPTPAPLPPSSSGKWEIANERGLCVWIPAGVQEKIPVSTPTPLEGDGELVTVGDAGVALRTPSGGIALLAPRSMASLDDGALTLLHGSIWLLGEETMHRKGERDPRGPQLGTPVYLSSKGGGLVVRGLGSFSISDAESSAIVRAFGDNVQVEEGGGLAHGFSIGRLRLFGTAVRAVERDREGLIAVGWAAPLLDPGPVREALLTAHLEAFSDRKFGELAVTSLIDHFGREAIPALRAELLAEVKESAESPRKWHAARALRGLIERGVLGNNTRPDRAARRTIASLFALPLDLDVESAVGGPVANPVRFGVDDTTALEEALLALAAATGVGPVPELEAWIVKIEPKRRKDYLEKWRAVWRKRIERARE